MARHATATRIGDAMDVAMQWPVAVVGIIIAAAAAGILGIGILAITLDLWWGWTR